MVFKIVQTKENGEICLITVPSAWENNGILFWPTTKKVSLIQRLLRDGRSKPEQNWTTQRCVKKKDNLLNYESAEIELQIIQQENDTDGCIFGNSTIIIKEEESLDSNIAYEDPLLTNLQNFNNEHQQQQQHQHFDQPIMQYQSLDEVIDIESILRNLNDSLKNIEANQIKITRELVKQTKYKDMILNRISNLENLFQTNQQQTLIFESECNIISDLLNSPVNNIIEANELEDKLTNDNEVDSLIRKMKSICGDMGTADPINCCYRLIDHFFTREFLLNVSWSGGSRSETSKIPLKNFPKILNVFNLLVRLAAGEFGPEENKHFFQTVLKNSKRRSETNADKIPRCSTKKIYARKHVKRYT